MEVDGAVAYKTV